MSKLINSVEIAGSMIEKAEPWNGKEKYQYTGTARQCLEHSYNHSKSDPDNCGGCALTLRSQYQPNYAGWQRIYIESRRTIPARWEKPFYTAFTDDNQLYAKALARSCKTYGIKFESKYTN